MTITVKEAKELTCAAMLARATETAEKSTLTLEKIEEEIKEAASAGLQENHIGLRSYMMNSEFPDMEMAKNFIASTVRRQGFTVKWEDYILIVKW